MSSSAGSLPTQIGSVHLDHCVMPASGTAGHGTEMLAFIDPGDVGAFVVKSLSADPWGGNPAPRVLPASAGSMLNSVGLQGPGIAAWRRDSLPALVAASRPVVVSIWGRSVDDYQRAAAAVADCGPAVVAVEVNLSCPNLQGKRIFAHDPEASAQVIAACSAAGKPLWAKLSANTDRTVDVAASVSEAGAEAVVLINTMMGMSISLDSQRPALGAGSGGLSGAAIHPIAVRTVFEVRRNLPDLAIVGVGGICAGTDAVEMILAGANAVQVGTASFAEPAALARISCELREWCGASGVTDIGQITGRAQSPAPATGSVNALANGAQHR